VLVIQPAENAFSPSLFLLRRVQWVAVPLLLLLPLAAWSLVGQYHRQQQLTRQLAEKNARLQRADRAKSDLLANVSHDLKTPIASMQLAVSDILEIDGPPEAEQVTECLDLVNVELDQLASRVRNLLDMTRLDADVVAGCRELCDLTEVVAAVLERLRLRLRERPLEAHFPREPLLVECDPTQMETVVLNLLENALKYSPSGSPLYVSGHPEAGNAIFQLRDEGPGIAPGDQVQIFDKFYRAPTQHAAGGTGLGLAICKAIIEAHGGTIAVCSAPGGGAMFRFALPLITEG
jgi:two-component system sensor histidine kinase KdpD